MKYRDLRVGQLLRDELAKFLIKEFEFPGAVITVTEVAVDKKLDTAAVKVSILPADKTEKAFKSLQKSQGYFQHLLNKKLNIKPMPRIHFELDLGPENAARVEKILLEDEGKS